VAAIDELVTGGSSTGVIDPLGIGDFMAPEREYIAKVSDAIEEVICRTERHDHGIVYSVVMVLAPSVPYDDQPDCDRGHEIWQRFVRFGVTAGTQAGGHHFVVAAQDQEAIGAYAWRAMEAANPPLEGPAETYPHDGGRY